MSEKKLQKKIVRRIIAVITVAVIVFILAGSLPITWCQKLETSGIHHFQYRENRHYMLRVENGKKYTITVFTSTTWNSDLNIQVYHTPYRVLGERKLSLNEDSVTYDFTAEKDGYYYVIIGFKGQGFYSLLFSEVSSFSSDDQFPHRHVNFWNLLLLLSPLVLCGVLIPVFVKKYRIALSKIGFGGIKEIKWNKNLIKTFPCASCGKELPKGTDYCRYCGCTYSPPNIPEFN